jgi:hypothetical protein
MQDIFNPIGFECFVQSEQASYMTNGYKEVERCSES